MNIFNFTQSSRDENVCIAHFKAQCEQKERVCPKCGNKEHIWLKNKLNYECKHCYSRQSLHLDTVLEDTKLPFQHWYVAMYFLTFSKKPTSASKVQRQLGHKRHQPICELFNDVKQLLLDMHHQITKEYLRYYLYEFCHKFNHRYFGEKLYERLVAVATGYPKDFRSRIYNRTACG